MTADEVVTALAAITVSERAAKKAARGAKIAAAEAAARLQDTAVVEPPPMLLPSSLPTVTPAVAQHSGGVQQTADEVVTDGCGDVSSQSEAVPQIPLGNAREEEAVTDWTRLEEERQALSVR